jgi:hypothetical protein
MLKVSSSTWSLKQVIYSDIEDIHNRCTLSFSSSSSSGSSKRALLSTCL